jgi:hypothetical protein
VLAGRASISAGVQHGMGTTKMRRIARLSSLHLEANLRTEMLSVTWVADWLLQLNLEPVNFKRGEMKSAVVRVGGTESCGERRFRG